MVRQDDLKTYFENARRWEQDLLLSAHRSRRIAWVIAAMREHPSRRGFDADDVRTEKAKVVDAIQLQSRRDALVNSVRGQYRAGDAKDRRRAETGAPLLRRNP